MADVDKVSNYPRGVYSGTKVYPSVCAFVFGPALISVLQLNACNFSLTIAILRFHVLLCPTGQVMTIDGDADLKGGKAGSQVSEKRAIEDVSNGDAGASVCRSHPHCSVTTMTGVDAGKGYCNGRSNAGSHIVSPTSQPAKIALSGHPSYGWPLGSSDGQESVDQADHANGGESTAPRSLSTPHGASNRFAGQNGIQRNFFDWAVTTPFNVSPSRYPRMTATWCSTPKDSSTLSDPSPGPGEASNVVQENCSNEAPQCQNNSPSIRGAGKEVIALDVTRAMAIQPEDSSFANHAQLKATDRGPTYTSNGEVRSAGRSSPAASLNLNSMKRTERHDGCHPVRNNLPTENSSGLRKTPSYDASAPNSLREEFDKRDKCSLYAYPGEDAIVPVQVKRPITLRQQMQSSSPVLAEGVQTIALDQDTETGSNLFTPVNFQESEQAEEDRAFSDALSLSSVSGATAARQSHSSASSATKQAQPLSHESRSQTEVSPTGMPEPDLSRGTSLEDKEKSWVDFLTNIGSADLNEVPSKDSSSSPASLPLGLDDMPASKATTLSPATPASSSSRQMDKGQGACFTTEFDAGVERMATASSRASSVSRVLPASTSPSEQSIPVPSANASPARSLSGGVSTVNGSAKNLLNINWPASWASAGRSAAQRAATNYAPPKPGLSTFGPGSVTSASPTGIPRGLGMALQQEGPSLPSHNSALPPNSYLAPNYTGLAARPSMRPDQQLSALTDYSFFHSASNTARTPTGNYPPGFWQAPSPSWKSGFSSSGTPTRPYYPYPGAVSSSGYLAPPPCPPQMMPQCRQPYPVAQSVLPTHPNGSGSAGNPLVHLAGQQPVPAPVPPLHAQPVALAASQPPPEQSSAECGGYPAPCDLSNILNSGAQQVACGQATAAKSACTSDPNRTTSKACEPTMDEMAKLVDPLWLLMGPNSSVTSDPSSTGLGDQFGEEMTAMLAKDPISAFASAAALITSSSPTAQQPSQADSTGTEVPKSASQSCQPVACTQAQEKVVNYPMDSSCEAVRKRRSTNDTKMRSSKKARRSAPATTSCQSQPVQVSSATSTSSQSGTLHTRPTPNFSDRPSGSIPGNPMFFPPPSFCHGSAVWANMYPPPLQQGYPPGSEYSGTPADFYQFPSINPSGIWHNPLGHQEHTTGSPHAAPLSSRVRDIVNCISCTEVYW